MTRAWQVSETAGEFGLEPARAAALEASLRDKLLQKKRDRETYVPGRPALTIPDLTRLFAKRLFDCAQIYRSFCLIHFVFIARGDRGQQTHGLCVFVVGSEARCLLNAFRHFNFGDSNTADARCFARTVEKFGVVLEPAEMVRQNPALLSSYMYCHVCHLSCRSVSFLMGHAGRSFLLTF